MEVPQSFNFIVYLDNKHQLHALQYEFGKDFGRKVAFMKKEKREGRVLDFGAYPDFPSEEHALRMAELYLTERPANMPSVFE